jgi:Ribonucleotide reductase alpha domain/LAGLIDADG-like domain
MTQATVFPALTGDPVYFRTYSRFTSFGREQWENTVERMIDGLCKLGNLDERQESLLRRYALDLKAMPSGRWCWVGGTEWLEQPENFSGAYNCSNFCITSFERMAFMMSLSMMGVGTGTRLEREFVGQLPVITTKLNVEAVGEPGALLPIEQASIKYTETGATIIVGDSREGWCRAYELLLELSAMGESVELDVKIELGHIRAAGAKIKGFGGVTNPVGLVRMFTAVAEILNRALGRQLTSVEVCLILDEVALAVVAGNVRRSANMRQFNSDDAAAATAKDNMYRVDEHGVFSIDPAKDAFRMGNHTLVFHTKPDLARCVEAVTKQWRSGEGAIMWAGESIARSNADILDTPEAKAKFLKLYGADRQLAREFLSGVPMDVENEAEQKEYDHRMTRCGINPCFAAGTMVLTSDGHFPIEELVGKTAKVWDGNCWRIVTNFRVTGENQRVFKITLASGDSITATERHSFILENHTRKLLCELEVGNVLLKHLQVAPRQVLEPKFDDWSEIVSIEYSHVADKVYCCTIPGSHSFGLSCGILVGNCGEILGTQFVCNLSEIHLNQLDPLNLDEQLEAFECGGLTVSILLHHEFLDPEQRYSRELDPIVGVSFTGLFDFFVQAFGVDWLRWWQAGRPNKFNMSTAGYERCYAVAELLGVKIKDPFVVMTSEGGIYRTLEAAYLSLWRGQVDKIVGEYCQANGLKTPNRCTTVQPSGCLDRTALRIFDQGLLYADEIVAEGSGETIGLDLSVRSGIPVNTAIANQPLNLVKVTLRNGRQLRMTTNHRMSVRGEWVEAVNLKPNMVIDYQIGCYDKLDDCPLIGVDSAHYTREFRSSEVGSNRGVMSRSITTPATLSPDLGYFLGALFGNGCFSEHKYRVRFAHEYISVLNRLSGIGESLFGMAGSLHDDPRGGRAELCFASKQLFDWFHQNNIAKTVKSKDLDRIPEPIRRSSRTTLLSFFCGLIDTDGCIRKDGKLSIDSASESFIRNLQQVGESIGLSFGISHNTKGSNHQEVKSMWSLSLSRTKSTPQAIDYINEHSIKAQLRPITFSTKTNGGELYVIVAVEPETVADYSYDFAVEGVDDNDAWYWQGGLKSHNTKSLLTGASPGWHAPKAAMFLRRMTFRRNDPVALACIELGYSVIPSQADKDENNQLLNDPFDPRCTEWLVEIPIATSWADLDGVEDIDISKFSAIAQFDFYMQVQKYYTCHNTSATIELREEEILPLATKIYESIRDDEGYISAALLQRFDTDFKSYPRLPFEPISKETYHRLVAEVAERNSGKTFAEALAKYDNGDLSAEVGPAGCDGDRCLMAEVKPEAPVVEDINSLFI